MSCPARLPRWLTTRHPSQVPHSGTQHTLTLPKSSSKSFKVTSISHTLPPHSFTRSPVASSWVCRCLGCSSHFVSILTTDPVHEPRQQSFSRRLKASLLGSARHSGRVRKAEAEVTMPGCSIDPACIDVLTSGTLGRMSPNHKYNVPVRVLSGSVFACTRETQ